MSTEDQRATNARRAAEASSAGDLAEWLAAVVAEVRRVAEAAPPGPWRASGYHSVENNDLDPDSGAGQHLEIVSVGDTGSGGGAYNEETVAHIVLNDPLAALDQCEAVESLLDVHGPYRSEEIGNRERCFTCGTPADPWPCITLRCAALAYRRWPGYRAEWKP